MSLTILNSLKSSCRDSNVEHHRASHPVSFSVSSHGRSFSHASRPSKRAARLSVFLVGMVVWVQTHSCRFAAHRPWGSPRAGLCSEDGVIHVFSIGGSRLPAAIPDIASLHPARGCRVWGTFALLALEHCTQGLTYNGHRMCRVERAFVSHQSSVRILFPLQSQSLFSSPVQFFICPRMSFAPSSGECCRPSASVKSPSGSIR